MPNAVQEFLTLVDRYRLEELLPQLARDIEAAREGRLAASRARMRLHQIEPVIADLERRPLHLLAWPTREELDWDDRDIRVGTLWNAPQVECRLALRRNSPSVLAHGCSGSGKTTFIRRIIQALDTPPTDVTRVVQILFAHKAHDFASLRARGDHWILLGNGEFASFGLQNPRSVPVHVWASVVAYLFAAATGLVYGATVIAGALTWLVHHMNPAGGVDLLWPDFRLLLETIRRNPEAWAQKPAYAESVGQMLTQVDRASGKLFSAFRGADVNELISQGKNIIIDLSSVEPAWLRLVLVWLVTASVMLDRNVRGHRVSNLEVLITLDDAGPYVSRTIEARFPGTLSWLSRVCQEGRELGVALLLGLHQLGPVAREILTNCRVTATFGTHHSEDVLEASKLNLLRPGAERVLPALDVGECLIMQTHATWSSPYLAVIDPETPADNVPVPTPDRIPVVPARSLDELPHVKAALDALRRDVRVGTTTLVTDPVQLSELAVNLAKAWIEKPFYPLAVLWRQLDSPLFDQQLAARKALVDVDFCDYEDMRISRRTVGVMVLKPAAYAYLGKEAPVSNVGGSPGHANGQRWIADVGRKRGHITYTEARIPGTKHIADVVEQTPAGWIVYEVVIKTKSNLVQHAVATLLDATVPCTLVVVATEKKILPELEALLRAAPSLANVQDRIRYETLETYRQELFG